MSNNKKPAVVKPNSPSIRVRMYRVGFGDCFLLSLPITKNHSTEYRHIVIDCGVHGKGNIGTIEKAVDNIAVETNKKLAAVIATHSHQDHISGFSEKFCDFEIGEVWLPWCENPKDELANSWRKKQAALLAQVENHFAAQAKIGAAEAKTPTRESALAAVANLTSNTKALQLLRGGFNVGAVIRYLQAGNELQNVAQIPGLSVKVLGPPRDEKFLAKMDPPKDQGYLRVNNSGSVEDANKLKPFPAKWQVAANQNLSSPFLNKDEEAEMQEKLNDTSLDGLAFALDAAKNNTSLVTLFIFRGQYLLFPGDAQYGNWRYWLDEEEADEILSRISFLKVAHHGSHNATPRDALEKMTPGGFAAMVSTQSVPWESIPRVPLMKRLNEQTKQKVVRSDWIAVKNAPSPLSNTAPLKPANLPDGFREGDFWYDYEIHLP